MDHEDADRMKAIACHAPCLASCLALPWLARCLVPCLAPCRALAAMRCADFLSHPHTYTYPLILGSANQGVHAPRKAIQPPLAHGAWVTLCHPRCVHLIQGNSIGSCWQCDAQTCYHTSVHAHIRYPRPCPARSPRHRGKQSENHGLLESWVALGRPGSH